MGDVTSESRRDRIQVLVDGEWVDIGGTVRGFEIDESAVIADEVQQMPTSFEMSVTLTEGSASELRRALDLAEQYQREQRARRRLWLRVPLKPMLCGRLPMRLTS